MAAVAAMEPPETKSSAQPFPLECMICPKTSVFSDVSHLLTHVSSKAHLHQKFSMDFKAKSDPSVKALLQRFDEWYTSHSIEKLLSDRLAARGSRKARRNKKSGPYKLGSAPSGNGRAGVSPNSKNNLPHLVSWYTSSSGRVVKHACSSSHGQPLPTQTHLTCKADGDMEDSRLSLEDTQVLDHMGSSHSTSFSSELDSSFSMSAMDDDLQAAKILKGTIWPGMHLFDSATPDQKKMRNQKKGSAAVDQLKLTSENINAIETVWESDGAVRKERDIYASPSIEGTPPSTPPRKKKQRVRTGNLTQIPVAEFMGMLENVQNDHLLVDPAKNLVHDTLKNAQGTSTTDKPMELGDNIKSPGLSNVTADVEQALYSLPHHTHRHKSAFSVFYEASHSTANEERRPNAETIVVADTQTSMDGARDSTSFDRDVTDEIQNRPALQQLDPNLSISEMSPYFKHADSTRFYESRGDPLGVSFRMQSSPYGNGYQGLSSGPLHEMSSQSRSGSVYPAFDSHVFHSMGGGDASNMSFNTTGNRRGNLGDFGIEPADSPFAFHDPRDPALRDSNFEEPVFHNPRLFEL